MQRLRESFDRLFYRDNGISRALFTSSNDLPEYIYNHLRDNEIRLIHLLPGNFYDTLRFQIEHVPLVITEDWEASEIMEKKEVKSKIREGIEVHKGPFKAPEGRWWYAVLEYGEEVIKYYDSESNNVPIGTEPVFEALSYVWGQVTAAGR